MSNIDALIPVTSAPAVYKNTLLNLSTASILRIGEDIKSNLMQIAYIIADVDKNNAYKDDDFATVHEWTAAAFGYKQAMSYNLLKLGKEYVQRNNYVAADGNAVDGLYTYQSNLYTREQLQEHEDFTTTQMLRMLPLGHDKAKELVDAQLITPDMTCRDIKAVVDEYKPKKGNGNADQTEQTEQTDQTEQTEPKVEATTPRNKKLTKVSTDDLIAELVARGYRVISPDGLVEDGEQ